MPFPVSLSFPPPLDPPCNVRKPFKDRPKGLWRGRVTPRSSAVPDRKEGKSPDRSESDDSEAPSYPHKKLRTDSFSDNEDDDQIFWDFARRRSAEPIEKPPRTPPTYSTSSIARMNPEKRTTTTTTCDLDDWDDLKNLFARAAENYEGNEPAEALSLLRGVIHECHRFLVVYPDPSVLFATATPPDTPTTAEDKRLWARTSSSSSSSGGPKEPPTRREPPKQTELPTAFHALLGTALFLFGNIIAQDSSLALEGEPTAPTPYWLAALDVFETGENLPSRTSGIKPNNLPEDWRMAIFWGRTLVCLAEELVNRQIQARDAGHEDPMSVSLDIEEPKWPAESPFHAIAAQRQPVTRRMSFDTATPHDLLNLAMDQFSRGIFHMPHPVSPDTPASSTPSSSTTSSMFALPSGPDITTTFSRAKQLFTIASEVLHIVEKLESTTERQFWANWADSVLNQMKMEATTAGGDQTWQALVLRSRGRCRLIVGSAYAEEVESALESGDADVLTSEEADEARADLTLAIELFERTKVRERERGREDRAKEKEGKHSEKEEEDVGTLLVEALVTLANLTLDANEREALYGRAKAEAGEEMMDLDLEGDDYNMDESH